MPRIPLLLLVLTLAVFSVAESQACQIPVYRYALERWPAYPFNITVFGRGELTADQKKALDSLPIIAQTSTSPPNAIVHQVDLGGSPDPEALELWQSQENPELPWLVVQFPSADRMMVPAWSGKLNLDNAKMLFNSPARREVARRILQGDSAVWVLVESGDAKAAQATSAAIQNQLKKLETSLKLPEQDPDAPPSIPTSKVPLKIRFSVLRVRENDPAEKIFVKMLRQSSRQTTPDDAGVVAYPIFGRGRCLGGHAGDDLKPEATERECSFLIGPCSCQVKTMNPGVDLLMAVNWDDLITGKLAVDTELPPLKGLMPVAPVASGTNTGPAQPGSSGIGRRRVVLQTEPSVPVAVVQEKSNLIRNVFVALGGGTIFVLGGAFFLWRRRK